MVDLDRYSLVRNTVVDLETGKPALEVLTVVGPISVRHRVPMA